MDAWGGAFSQKDVKDLPRAENQDETKGTSSKMRPKEQALRNEQRTNHKEKNKVSTERNM